VYLLQWAFYVYDISMTFTLYNLQDLQYYNIVLFSI
jgi:hypothetical protein